MQCIFILELIHFLLERCTYLTSYCEGLGVEGWLAHTDTNTCAHVPLNWFKLSILTRINIYIEIKFVFTSTNIIILLLSFVDVIKATCWSSNWASASEEIGFDAVKPFVNIFLFF